jgi:hypothetical protein
MILEPEVLLTLSLHLSLHLNLHPSLHASLHPNLIVTVHKRRSKKGNSTQ